MERLLIHVSNKIRISARLPDVNKLDNNKNTVDDMK